MRSWLFVPGDSEKKLAKALGVGADALIIDLEDSVALDRKDIARKITAQFLTDNPNATSALYVRVNDLRSPWTDEDLASVMRAGPAGIVLPKSIGSRDVLDLAERLHLHEMAFNIEAGATRIVTVATESAEAVLSLAAPQGHPRLAGMMWGAEDLSADIGATSKRDVNEAYRSPFQLARDLCLLAARAAGVIPIDTVYPDFRDLKGFRAEAEAARKIGFSAKAAIHPDQVAVINEVFAPTAEEIARATRIVDAFAAKPGAGVISLDGEMVDRPHLRLAERILGSLD